MNNAKKEVSLVLRGFNLSPDEAEAVFGIAATDKGRKGDAVLPSVATKLSRSVISYRLEFSGEEGFDYMVTELISWLGGVEKVQECCKTIAPEFTQIEYIIPVRSLRYQESRYLTEKSVESLASIGASVGFSFR